MLYIIYTKNLPAQNKYHLVRSTVTPQTALKDLDWLQPFIDYSKLGYRLCGLIPFDRPPFETCFTVYWLFEQVEGSDSYDSCLLEYSFKSFSLNRWRSLLNFMARQEWKLVATFNSEQKKSHAEQLYFLLFFQRFTNQQD